MADIINKINHKHKSISKIFKRALALFIIVIINFNSYAAVVSSNDGSAFITKAEFDALVNDFNSRIEDYEKSIDAKIDGAIAEYLAGLATSITASGYTLFSSIVGVNNITCRDGASELPFVKGDVGVDYNFSMSTSHASDPRRGGKLVSFKLYGTPTATKRRYITKNDGVNYWGGYATDLLGYITASYISISKTYVFGNSDSWFILGPYANNTSTVYVPGRWTVLNILEEVGEGSGMVRPSVYSYAYREEKTLSSLYDYFYSSDQSTYYWNTDISAVSVYTCDIKITNSWRSFFDRAIIQNVQGHVWQKYGDSLVTSTNTTAVDLLTLKKYTGKHNNDEERTNRGLYEPLYSLSGNQLSNICYPDHTTYRYISSTNGGNTITNKTLSRYNMYAGVPLFTVTAGYEYEWPVKFLDTQSVDLYIKYEPFSEGVTESQCIEVSLNENKTKSKKATIPAGGTTVKFKAPESGLLFVKWKLSSSTNGGGTLDVTNSGVYTSISST